MSRGKHLSLEEARNTGSLDRFAKEHPSQADERFPHLLEAMAKGSLEGEETSVKVSSEGYSDTRTRQDSSEDSER